MTDFKKVFIDTAPFVYYIEENEQYFSIVEKFFMQYAESDLLTSVITIGEYLSKPYRENEKEYIDAFNDFIDKTEIGIIEITRQIAEEAAKIRGKYKGFKLPDSLQLASAVISGCDLFLTNDKQLKQYTEIECMTVEELKSNLCS